MRKFVRSLITKWRKLRLAFVGETIVVGVSGGADSMSLLLALHDLVKRKKISHRVIVADMNHNLRGKESDTDERFVAAYAELRIRVRRRISSNLKERQPRAGARNTRYKFFSDVASDNDAFAVLVAHTQNDQAETFLFNLIRGSGPLWARWHATYGEME